MALVMVMALFTACSSAPPESDLGLEELADGLYVGYDRATVKNVSAPKRYYAEIAVYGEDEMLPFFSEQPKISQDGSRLNFEGNGESGYTSSNIGGMFYGRDRWNELSIIRKSFYSDKAPAPNDLDFMPISELHDRFENDAHRFVPDMEIYETRSVTKADFSKVTAERDPPYPELGWSEPKDFYYVFARQFLDGIPLFTTTKMVGIEECTNGPNIEAIYSEDGTEWFDITGSTYNVTDEAPINGTFIDLAGAEQIVREIYALPYGYDQIILSNVDLVYVAVYDEDKRIVLTPMWEFYCRFDPAYTKECDLVWLRIDAYTGKLFNSNS